MELLDKFASRIFEYDNQEARKRFRPRQITLEQVRLLLFKECDWRGRKLLFDSASVQKVPANKDDKPNVGKDDHGPCIVEVTEGFSYIYKGPSADASILGEMIFGAVAMSYKGVSLKIHIMDEPRRIMCSKVFCVPSSRRISKDRTSDTDWRSSSKTLSVPLLKEEGMPVCFTMDRGDSGFCGDQSPYSSIGSTNDYFSLCEFWDGVTQEDFVFHSPPGRKLSASSNGSWQRRSFQSAATRFALGHTSSRLLSVPTGVSNLTTWDSQVYAYSSASDTSNSIASNGSSERRNNKLGLALLITACDAREMDEVRQCVEHSHQLQALVCRLRLAALNAGAGERFVSTLHTATIDAQRWLSDLLYGPRLQSAWLGLASSEPVTASARADSLLTDLCSVLAVADTKHTNFFISTLLTHMLTYHLGWVTTVSPYDTLDPQTASDKPEQTRPYNALWAQLSDLCGSIGVPPRAAKTVLCGTSNKLLNTLLSVLTYFLRSGEVTKSNFSYTDCALKELKVQKFPETFLNENEKECDIKKDFKVTCVSNDSVDDVTKTETDSDIITINVETKSFGLKRTKTATKIADNDIDSNTVENKMENESTMRRSNTLSSLNSNKLSNIESPETSQLNKTSLLPIQASRESSVNSNPDESSVEPEQNVVFVLGDNEKLVGLKNKSNDGKRVKKTSNIHNEPLDITKLEDETKTEACSKTNCVRTHSKCCSETKHSKQIKHSGFKFEFDKYPQIVTNYMKSKNLEILDRHYIGKPGNLKLDNFQFDPTVVPPIQEEKCETCYKCLQMEALLQTPTNASEMECMTDLQVEPQYAKVTVVEETPTREMSPKNFVHLKEENTLVVNTKSTALDLKTSEEKKEPSRLETRRAERARERNKIVQVRQVIEFPMPGVQLKDGVKSGFDMSLLGGVTDHYVPDLILQGTKASPVLWERELRRDLELYTYLNRSLSAPIQAVAIIGDTNSWEVRVVGRDCAAGGMSTLIGGMLDALPAMRRAKVPAQQCLSFVEGKLREVCILSKTLADMLMSTDFCDIATLTNSLNIDVNDVPLLLAVATTHTPQVAARYGISYR